MYVDADATDNFQQAVGAIHGFDYFCTGEESLLIQCANETDRCQHDDEAGVRCIGGRLV